MPQNTNLNVTPYYDDFDKNKNFYKVLFRPGFPIQARELTTMQSIMQNQVESIGQHLFKEGAMVIPGQVGYDLSVSAILIQESFLGAAVEQYRSQLSGKIITGLNTGIKAKVLYTLSAADSEKGYITLYVKYIESDDETATKNTFDNNEQLVASNDITFGTTLIEVGSPFAQILPANGTAVGSAAYVNQGVYFIRGYFVDVPSQYILLDQYGNNPSYRVGLSISESIITSEDDVSLNDNAAGTSNYSAPGAHRFKISTTLIKKALDDDSDKNFVELLRISNSKVQKIVERTSYSELEKTLAARTYDESGDYTVSDFQIRMRESVNDGFNGGVYNLGQVTAQGNAAGDSLYAVEFGPGKAYVRGYQMETLQPTYVDLEKPRDTKAIQNTIIPFDLGNVVFNQNVYGFPNFSGSSVTSSYQTVELYDTATVTPGDITGNLIGYARVAASEYASDPDATFSNTDDQYQSNLFDINMFTVVEISSAQTINQGSLVVGATSGARGFIVDGITASTQMKLYQITGNFAKGEVIHVDGREKGSIAHLYKYEFTDARQMVSRDETTNNIEFTSDLVLNDIVQLRGDAFQLGSSGTTITGFNSNFGADLRPGDYLFFNASNYVIVDRVNPAALGTTNYTNIINTTTQVATCIAANAPADGTYSPVLRFRPSLQGRENADLFSPMPRESIKSISDESMTVRRTFDNISISSNAFTVTLPENEQFSSISRENYTLVVTGGSGVGDVIEVQDTASGVAGYATFTSSDRTTLQVTGLTAVTSVKLTATISKNVTTKKIKSSNSMFVLKVFKTIQELDNQLFGLQYSNLYGTRIEDKEISLGLPDGYRLRAVYESYDDNDPVIPSMQLVEPAFFAVGSVIVGRTSGARGLVVDFASTTLRLTFVTLSGTFIGGETIDGLNSQQEAISALINDNEGSIVVGSKDVTDNYYMDSGQRGMFYDCSRLVRVAGAAAPIRKLKVVVDWFSHQSTGDYFAGQSYTGIAYKDIPKYKNIELRDVLDFRPAVKPLYSGTGTVGSPAYVNCSTYDFKSRVFDIGGLVNATVFDIPKIDTDFRCDYDYYLRRIDKVFLTADREFQVVKGVSDDNPSPPEDIKNAMFLAIMRHRPYGYNPDRDVYIKREDNRRYTMRDIGEIEQRLSQVEYYTALSMLETDTNSLKITDANGKDRFKNGYIVDDFSSHNVSDLQHEDYRASLDFANGECRPTHYTTNVALEYQADLSTVQKTGPVLTLPYEEMLVIQQPYASRVENVNPFNVFTYIGRIDLTPASDDWVDTKRLPARVENIEGDFSAVARENNVDQNGFAPVQWNSWQTDWTGETVGGTRRYLSHTNLGGGNWLGGTGWFMYVHEARDITVTERQSRTGIRTRVVPRIDRKSMGDTLISQTSIPWIRSRNVGVSIARLKPRTTFYPFFDGQSVANYITPKLIELIKDPNTDSRTNATPFVIGETVTGETSGVKLKVVAPNDGYKWNPYDDTELPDSYSSETVFLNVDTEAMATQVNGDYYGNIQVGEVLVGTSGAKAVVKARRILTDRIGQYFGTLFIPDPGNDANPRWATGKRVLRMTTSETNSFLTGAVSSSADVTYEASGTLNTVQENILAIRNADIVRDTVTDTQTITSTRSEVRQIGWWDPLAQSFLVDDEGGVFVTSAEFYFFTRDSNIPINCQIRSMVNGYPSNKILPFSDTTVKPEDVQLSESAAIPTKFTFRAPVYLQQGVEYALILFTDSNEYQVWISRMGDIDVTGDRTISEQPYAGVLFKSQNASTWTADQYEDLKFNLYRAKFNTNGAMATFTNSRLGLGNGGVLHLRNNPIQTHKPDQIFVLDGIGKTFTVGARIYQKTSNALATISAVNTVTNPNQITVTDISGAFQVGSNTGGVVTYSLVSSRSEGTMTILAAGLTGDFEVGTTITGQTSGATAEVVSWDSGNRLLTLKFVSKTFTDNETVEATNSGGTVVSGVIDGANHTVTGDSVESFVSITPTFDQSTKKVTVLHSNHGMHDTRNNVVVENVESEVNPTYLTAGVDDDDTTIPINDARAFHTVVNGLGISNSNPGYIKIGDEIISYNQISADGKSITVVDRGANNTTASAHAESDVVHCYNLDGIPLIEINKTHNQIANPTLDTYELVTQSVGRLGVVSGGPNASATQNIPFEVLTPTVQNLVLPKTEMSARIATISGSSINDGVTSTQNSFVDDGVLDEIILNEQNYFASPRMVCSQINEDEELNGQKSLRLECSMSSDVDNVSPYIDLDRVSLITTSNRVNNPSNPTLSKQATGDPHAAVYLTKVARLTNTSRSIKVMFSAYRPNGAEIDVLYKVVAPGSGQDLDEIGYEYFPTADATIPASTDQVLYSDYEYEVTGLEFAAYQIKIVMRSANQAYPPQLKEFRAIALAS